MAQPKPNPRTKTMAVLTKALVSRLDAVAEREVKNRSLVIREACEEFLKQKERAAA